MKTHLMANGLAAVMNPTVIPEFGGIL
jgi:hypothetical protein